MSTHEGASLVHQSVPSALDIVGHVLQFVGNTWYVDAGVAASGDGTSPLTAFQTIGEAIAVALTGDAITVGVGTYDETGLDLALLGIKLIAELGAVLTDTAVGAQTLLVSGDFCIVSDLNVEQAGQPGIRVTGDHCRLSDIHSHTSTTAVIVSGAHNTIEDVFAHSYTVEGYNITGPSNLFNRCDADGESAAVVGVHLSAATAIDNSFRDCSTRANATNGWVVAANAIDNTFSNCTMGTGDGPRVDPTNSNLWANFSFDNIRSNEITLTGALTYNLFKITGVVQINYIYGVVSVALPAAVTTASLDLFPTAGVAIQLTSVGGVDISAAPVGSMVSKSNLVANPLVYADSTLGFVSETTGNIFALFTVGQKTGGVVTHIRFKRAGAGASGAIHWYVDWEPISDDGFLEVA